MSIASDFNLQRLNTKEYADNVAATIEFGGNLLAIGQRGSGKMLDLETELPTPKGFVKLKDLKEGDKLFDETGKICKITQLHPIDENPISYQMTFDDGTIVNACKDHLWFTWNKSARVAHGSGPNPTKFPEVRTTQEILDTLKTKTAKKETNHSILCAKPIQYTEKKLPIDPYLLGLWLGDGSRAMGSIETSTPELLSNYTHHIVPSSIGKSKSSKYIVDNLFKQLRLNNLLYNKHIPKKYLISSYEQRLALLQGLMDTDGSCDKGGGIEYTSVIPQLAQQVLQLVRSMGIKANCNQNEAWLYNKKCKDRYRITFTTSLPIFRLKEKLQRIKIDKQQLNRTTHRYIVDIKPINSVPMRCITVDSPSHLFLITNSFIATHNTAIQRETVKNLGLREVYLNLSTLERVDLGGYPDFFGAKNGSKYIQYLLPEFYRNLIENDDKAVVILDEVDKADQSIFAPLLEFTQFHSINGNGMKNLQAILMTGNLQSEGGNRPPLPLLDRTEKYLIEVNVEQWLDWGAKTGEIHPSISAFITEYRDELQSSGDPGDSYSTQSPRGWHNASKILFFGEANNWNPKMLLHKVAGCVGKTAGIKYSAFFDHYQFLIPFVEKVIKGESVREFKDFEPTRKIVICMILCNRFSRMLDIMKSKMTKEEQIEMKFPDKEKIISSNIAKFLAKVDPEMSYITMRSQIGGARFMDFKLLNDPNWDGLLNAFIKKMST